MLKEGLGKGEGERGKGERRGFPWIYSSNQPGPRKTSEKRGKGKKVEKGRSVMYI